MPSYDYECEECGFKFRVSHSITNKLTDCVQCDAPESLVRYSGASTFWVSYDQSENKKVGTVVKESIEDFKDDLEQQKREIRNRSFDG